MNKFIKLIIVCHTLLLYCCSGNNNPTLSSHNPMKQYPTKTQHSSQPKENTLTADEQIKFDTIIQAFNKIIEKDQQLTTEHKEKYKNFENWLLKDLQKQKELAEHFKYAYNIFENIQPTQAKKTTTKQLIVNTIDCVLSNTCNGRNDIYSSKGQSDDSEKQRQTLTDSFKDLLYKMFGIPHYPTKPMEITTPNQNTNTNEDIFKYLISELIFPASHIIRYNANYNTHNNSTDPSLTALGFNDNQIKTIQEIIIPIFTPKGGKIYSSKYIDFMRLSYSITKPILDYINNELSKCNGNQKSIDDFYSLLESYLGANEINEDTVSKLPNTVTIKCSNGS
ncbi:Mlp family lipoprotein (plasmid) [Borrelia coriaceae]|uniref:Mlp lipoprotein family protein n=1 Tax=Borrelia coriaceae ATCC 43381 TaxID=1408429 RepID=W5SWU3_9SPIR|nr:Mlp family lipoprotein [Borrelia coriaceae]AHH11360.1 Mlp lipoprotein family protein [Borrelia coriaceae ATCC 43381]UPA17514.1 Mlp family lipoprotein [Borrelia coriaceae]